jgi:hypothetical protein
LTDAGEEIRVAHRKRMDIRVRQAVIDGSPAYAVVGGKKDAATSIASKEILPAYGKATHDAAIKRCLNPLGIANICRDGEQEEKDKCSHKPSFCCSVNGLD